MLPPMPPEVQAELRAIDQVYVDEGFGLAYAEVISFMLARLQGVLGPEKAKEILCRSINAFAKIR